MIRRALQVCFSANPYSRMKKSHFLSHLSCALVTAGCVSTQETYNADGSKGHVISCTPGWTSGVVGSIANAATNWGTCYQKAGDLCGTRGYTVLTKSDEPGFAANASQYGASVSTTNNRMMIVRCNGAEPLRAQ